MENFDSLLAIRYSQKALPKQTREKPTGVVPALVLRSNPLRMSVIARSDSDEAIQSLTLLWIASLRSQ